MHRFKVESSPGRVSGVCQHDYAGPCHSPRAWKWEQQPPSPFKSSTPAGVEGLQAQGYTVRPSLKIKGERRADGAACWQSMWQAFVDPVSSAGS